MTKFIPLTIVLAVFISACASGVPESGTGVSTPVVITAEVSTVLPATLGPLPTPGPSPTPIPATPIPTLPSSSLSPTELKYRVLDQFPDFFFCDPDYYPVARADEMELALQRFPELEADREEFDVVLDRNGLSGNTTFTDDQKLLIYREHKQLNAISFEVAGDQYQFQIQTGTEGQEGSLITATIDGDGSIDIQNQEPSFPACPICLTAGTLIDTPQGFIAVEDLRVGDSVWTINQSGERVVEPILRTSHVPVPAGHGVVHVTLSDGRELWASPGHPTADRRMLNDLKINDLLDGARVILIERLLYDERATYDLLPSGDTGFYWANGILMGSTLRE